MRYGKLDVSELKEYVLQNLKASREEVVLSATVGEDCAAIKTDEFILLTCDPITCDMSPEKLGALAVNVSCNDVASNGGDPLALMFTLILTPSSPPETVDAVMKSAQAAAERVGADIVGGHTEFSPAVNFPICSVTAVGKTARVMKKSDLAVGDRLFVTKSLALEAATILACDCENKLTEKQKTDVSGYGDLLSVVPESRILRTFSEVHAMHDVTEGGVLGAVAEICIGAGLGAEIYDERLPILDTVSKICALCGADPRKSLSSGAMLFAATDGKACDALLKVGIDCTEIGRITDGEVFLVKDGVKTVISVEPDGIYSAETRR